MRIKLSALNNTRDSQKGFGLIGIVIVFFTLLLVSGIGWYIYSWKHPSGAVSYQEVSSHPEASLLYPGSTLIGKRGGSQQPAEFGNKNPASAGGIAVTAATSQQVNDFYHQWMTTHGWTSYPVSRVGDQLSNQGYQRGARESFGIGIDDPTQYKDIASKYPGETIYNFLYILTPP